MAKRVSQVVVEVVYKEIPKLRVSQVVVEAMYVPTGGPTARPKFHAQVIG